jgi:glucose-1-phosphate adenylyltransferase
MKRTMAVILAGGEGERLSILSSVRAKPAVPFGGKYRIIDFTLSNCVNSDIDNVVVLTQYNPRSLNDHIGLGRPWDLDRNTGGVKLLQPYIARGRVAEWYRGTADAVLQNFNVLEHDPSDTILVLAGDHIYKMDYQPFIQAHRRRRADVTIAVRRVPLADAPRMGILALDEDNRVVDWQEKPKHPKSDLASMGVYVFSKRALKRWLTEDVTDFGAHVVPHMLEAGARVYGYRFGGYWQDVGTVQSFWEANMALLDDQPELDLYDREWTIHTKSEERAPAKIGPTAQVHRSLVSHGCVINGTVVNSVLSPGVRVDVGAVVRDSIVMFDSVIRSGAVVDRSILDKEVVVGQGAMVGHGDDFDTPNRHEPGRLNTGISVVGKRSVIPRATRIGRNVRIGGDVRSSDFPTRVVRSGQSVDRVSDRRARGSATPRKVAAAAGGGAAAVGGVPVMAGIDPQGGNGHNVPAGATRERRGARTTD